MSYLMPRVTSRSATDENDSMARRTDDDGGDVERRLARDARRTIPRLRRDRFSSRALPTRARLQRSARLTFAESSALRGSARKRSNVRNRRAISANRMRFAGAIRSPAPFLGLLRVSIADACGALRSAQNMRLPRLYAHQRRFCAFSVSRQRKKRLEALRIPLK
jgi:hypothetical protein